MGLFLVQHGKSQPREVDPGQGLSKVGFSKVEQIAKVAQGYNVVVSRIVHSGKRRALQTAEILDAFLQPASGIREESGLKPLDDVAAWAEKIDPAENLMVVGHLPFLSRLTSLLIAGSTDNPVFKFQNGGIVCLDIDPDSLSWVIRWALMPDIG